MPTGTISGRIVAPKEVELTTGLGYIVRDGKIIEKFELPPGTHKFPGDVEVVEVSSREELNQVEIYQEPVQETDEQKLIRLREIILDKMIAGEDYSQEKAEYLEIRQRIKQG